MGGVRRAPRGPPKMRTRGIFERQLGVFFEGGGEPAGVGVGFDLAGELGDDAALRVFDREVGRQQRTEGVLEGLCQEEGAVQRPQLGFTGFGVELRFGAVFCVFGEQRAGDFDRADLRGIGALGGVLVEVDRALADFAR